MEDIDIFRIVISVIPIVLAIVVHEASHAAASLACGDDLAWRMGRVTLNPLKHIDPFGTIILPVFLYATTGMIFGWAKPVPYRPASLRNPRWGSAIVAAAGPASNFVLAFLSAIALVVLGRMTDEQETSWVLTMTSISLVANVMLGVFNMIPIPPLDGSKVLMGFLPSPFNGWLARLEKYGFLILMVFLFILPAITQRLGMSIDPVMAVVSSLTKTVTQGMIAVVDIF